MKNEYVSALALEAALRSVGIKRSEVDAAAFERQAEFYYIRLQTLFLCYEFYVDGNLCVRGVNTEPVSEQLRACSGSAAKLTAA